MMEVDKCVKCGDNLWRYGAGNPLKCRNCDTYQTTDAPTTPDDKLAALMDAVVSYRLARGHTGQAEAAVRAAALAYGRAVAIAELEDRVANLVRNRIAELRKAAT